MTGIQMLNSEFCSGARAYTHQINYISFAKDLAKQIGCVKTFTLGVGAEYRFENYRTSAGEEAAWKDYDGAGQRAGGAQASGAIHPNDIVNESRGIAGVYVDLETDVNNHLLINVTSRFEHNNDYGNNLAGKLAMRYKFSSRFLLRGSVSNGYHAPALQQFYLMATNPAWKNGNPITTGIFPNNHAVTKAFGVQPLQPEKAINVSGGFTSKLSQNINLTVDAYWIQIKNRIILSGIFDRNKNADANRALQDYPDIDQVQFIANAINTKTQGIDIVMNGGWKVSKSNVGFMAAANFTQTKLFGAIQTTDKLPGTANANTLFNREEREKIEHGQPASKIILSANYKKGKMGILLRSTRFGKTSIVLNSDDTSRDEAFSAKILTDFSITYTPKTWITITAGAINIFDIYPDPVKHPLNKNQGVLIYSNEATSYGYNGGYYFMTMSFNF